MIKSRFTLLLMPDGDGGGGNSFLASLPAEIQGAECLKTVPDVATLAKNYVNAQSMIGKRIEAPQQNWGANEWGALYDRLGRPKTPGEYKMPEGVKLPAGVSVDEKTRDEAFKVFHEAGLTGKQAETVMKLYLTRLTAGAEAQQRDHETKALRNKEALQAKFGESTNEVIDLARAALKRAGSSDFVDYLNETGLGDDPRMIEVFYKLGKSMMEDNAMGGGLDVLVKDSTAAKAEIQKLTANKEFMDVLNKVDATGHKEAVARWMELHSTAYPGKQTT